MTREEKKEELIGLFSTGAIFIGDLIDECFEFGQHHPHWISGDDELPKIIPNGGEWEFSDDVIVEIKDGDIAVGRYERDNSTGEHYWVLYGVDKDLVITHWMSLPAPPEHFADVSKKISGSSEIPNNHFIDINKMVKKGGKE